MTIKEYFAKFDPDDSIMQRAIFDEKNKTLMLDIALGEYQIDEMKEYQGIDMKGYIALFRNVENFKTEKNLDEINHPNLDFDHDDYVGAARYEENGKNYDVIIMLEIRDFYPTIEFSASSVDVQIY